MIISQAVVDGYERLAAWSDLLDGINVYPVADGDTGRNLIVSLAPLRDYPLDGTATIEKLLMSARGNSGNIASRFFSSFLKISSIASIAGCVKEGSESARSAVDAPRNGTMLTLFDDLASWLEDPAGDFADTGAVIARLEQSVRSTRDMLPRLREAGVADSGALGMFLFFEGFFQSLSGKDKSFVPVTERFGDLIKIDPGFRETRENGFCVDMVLRVDGDAADAAAEFSSMGESVVVIPGRDCLKVHLHTDDPEAVRARIGSMGTLMRWSSDDLGSQVRDFRSARKSAPIHIVSDAAGSLTREDALHWGITLLDSYIIAGGYSVPETACSPEEIYGLMKKGVRVSTSQASVFERRQHYERLAGEHDLSLYLCVGSVYTGNYSAAAEWKKSGDPGNRLRLIDSGAASGKLGLAVLATARFARLENNPDSIISFAGKAVGTCEEYLFLDRLHYLAAGGRMSKTGAFFGDLVGVKPVVGPFPDGARKLGVVRRAEDQIAFALEKLEEALQGDSSPLIMIEYTDNREWVRDSVKGRIEGMFPGAEFIIQPLSLTTGAHTGPGTWGVAFLPGGMNHGER